MIRAHFHTIVHDRRGRLKHRGAHRPNLRTTAGIDWEAAVLGSGSQPAAMRYIALTADTTAPQTSDTTLAGEFTTSGLGRALATYAHTAGTTSFTQSVTFTATGTATINKEGLFNAAGPPPAGTLGFESLEPSPPTVVATDVTTETVTINF